MQAVLQTETEIVTDESLLSSAHSGDQRAFEELFTRHYRRLFLTAMRVAGNEQDAEEVVMDAFMKLHQQPVESSPDANIGGWLYRTVTNASFNVVRSRKRRRKWHDRFRIINSDSQSVGDDPAAVIGRNLEAEHVRDLLLTLSERDRNLLILRSSGLSYKEIAGAMEINESSIGTMLARAERKLRDHMTGEME